MKVGLLTQWYEPEPGPASLPSSLARGLAARGHDVRVVTGFPNYPHGRIADGYQQRRRLDETRDGVTVRRVALYPSHDNSAVHRALNYGSFAASALASGMAVLKDVDVLWVNYSPVTISLPMFWLHHRRGTPLVVHALDLWPDTVTASGLGGRLGAPATRALEALCSRIYTAADSVAYISPGVGDLLASRGVAREKLAYAPMWADESVHRPVESGATRGWGLSSDTLAIVYAGTLGGAQDLDTLIGACARITDLDITCLVAGSGTHETQLRERADRAGATNVRFLGRLDASGIQALNADADLHYVGLNDHPLARITMPSKVQAVLASGRPLVGALVGDAAHVVERAGGWTVTPGDVEGLEERLRLVAASGRAGLRPLREQARRLYDDEFSYDQGVGRIEKLLAVAAERSSGDRVARRGGGGAGLTLRPLRADDVARCAQLHVEAFPGFFLSQLGPRFLREFYRGFLSDPDAITVVAETPEGDLSGVVVGTFAPKEFFLRLLKRRFAGFVVASVLVVLRNPSAAPRLLKAVLYRGQVPMGVEGALLSSICVDPHTQSRGTGTQLITRFKEVVRSRDTGAYLLTDRDDNEGANAFYLRNSWTLAGTYETPEGRGMNCYVLLDEQGCA